jgi:SAM-dependent methyltransferase
MTVSEEFGDIDIYVFDQLQKGRIRQGDRVLDAGCGSGRNVVYMMRAGIEVWAVDANPLAVDEVRALAARLIPGLTPAQLTQRFRPASIEDLPFPSAHFSVVMASAVLHFAANDEAFDAMLGSLWRVLAPGGLLFSRLATSIGVESRIEPVGDRRYRLPDGSTRYLPDESMLMDRSTRLGGQLLDPLKTTLVQNQRAMTTWVLKKV